MRTIVRCQLWDEGAAAVAVDAHRDVDGYQLENIPLRCALICKVGRHKRLDVCSGDTLKGVCDCPSEITEAERRLRLQLPLQLHIGPHLG